VQLVEDHADVGPRGSEPGHDGVDPSPFVEEAVGLVEDPTGLLVRQVAGHGERSAHHLDVGTGDRSAHDEDSSEQVFGRRGRILRTVFVLEGRYGSVHATLTSRLVFFVVLAAACAAVLAMAVLGLIGNGSSSEVPVPPDPDPVSTVDPDVEHCLAAGGEPAWTDGEVVCLIPPATLDR
jgi:hypothetical protein